MEPQETCTKQLVSYTVVHATIFIIMLMMNSSACIASVFGNETDQLALLEFKVSIINDPNDIMGSWNIDSLPYCQWQGVTCGSRHQRVTSLDLSGQGLFGPISPHIGNLSFLGYMNLGDNLLYGQIPQEIGSLSRLRQLNLTINTLGGAIPSNLSSCKKLNILELKQNQLIGEIPQSLGNLSSLEIFSLRGNHLVGSIPNELGELRNLTFFSVGNNNLSGVVPLSLYNISSMITFDTAYNLLTGSIPADIGSTLPNLQYLGLYWNLFTGTIPASLANASHLQYLSIGNNQLRGQVPKEIGRLSSLRQLNIELNQLGGNPIQDLSFLVPLSNCTYLQILAFGLNNFEGRLADFGANFSIQLTDLHMSGNQIWGPIPEAIADLTNLLTLAMEANNLSGAIPSSFGRLEQLQRLQLFGNKLTGQIPSSLGNMSQLGTLWLSNNRFNGTIPESLGNCKLLQFLDVSQNNLSGPIPLQVLAIPSLSVTLNLSENMLSGPLPAEIGKLVSLNTLDITDNYLSGEIPASIGECSSLEYLYMGGNSFVGTIPSSLSSLKGIRYLDLSDNNLTGKIPKELVSLTYLQYLNLSFNELEGEIPTKGAFGNITVTISVEGNSKLCGGIPELNQPLCPNPEKKQKFPPALKLITALVCVAFFFIGATYFVLLYRKRKTRKDSVDSSGKEKLLRISYGQLYKATNGFSSINSIGSGGFGTVYKGILNNQSNQLIAVKVLNLQNSRASKSFLAECKVLRNIRHRNLLKILTYCSSIDSRRNDFKALVYEFMSNGNLDMLLHPNEANSSRTLSLLQRLNIAIDVASALQYLHNQCEVPIIHCDLKPSNILLDDEMIAHVGDFGLARFRPKMPEDAEISSIGVKGSIGYAAPEYGTGSDVSAFGDVYSYGIILLEMMTGRRPTDDIFKEGLNLHNYVKMALPNQVRPILDPILDRELSGEESEFGRRNDEIQQGLGNIGTSSHGEVEMENCIVSILTIALACSEESPTHRMDMNDITTKLHQVRGVILGHRSRN